MIKWIPWHTHTHTASTRFHRTLMHHTKSPASRGQHNRPRSDRDHHIVNPLLQPPSVGDRSHHRPRPPPAAVPQGLEEMDAEDIVPRQLTQRLPNQHHIGGSDSAEEAEPPSQRGVSTLSQMGWLPSCCIRVYLINSTVLLLRCDTRARGGIGQATGRL